MARCIALALLALTLSATAEERIADLRQGTNLSVALAPSGDRLVVDLIGQLWTLPASGGGAVPLTAPGEQARNPRFSPDGTLIVYQRRRGEQWDVWLLDIATGVERALTASDFDEREPEFAADGRSVLFATNRSGRYGLWSIGLDGGTPTPLTDDNGDASFPAVSEHGLIAYLRSDAGRWSIQVLDANGNDSPVYTSTQRLSAPTWRPGSGVLVFGEQAGPRSSVLQMLLLAEPVVMKRLTDAEDLFATRPAWLTRAEFIYSADGQLWRREVATPVRQPIHLFAAAAVTVATVPDDLPRLDPRDEQTAFGINGSVRSPDGRRTAFTALGDLWLADRDEPQRLTDDAFVDLDPCFWPDGESLVFASERTGQLELWRIAPRDRRLTQLTFGALAPRHPAVHPDGKRIAFLESTSLEPWASQVLKVLDLSSGQEVTLAKEVIGASPPTWSADGQAVALRAREAATVDSVGRGVRVDFQAIPHSDQAPGAGAPAAPIVRWQPPPPPADYVLEVGRLFDGVQGTYRRHVDVHVRGGRIAAIVGRGVLPTTGEIVDARDATVIPGLIDLHAHQSAVAGERLGRAWLAYGVTTVREIATAPREALERAETWASGRAPGPRLLISAAASTSPDPPDSMVPIRGYPGIAQGFAHSVRRQVQAIAVPGLDAPYPPRLAAEVSTPTLELELSPGLVAYQDGFSRLIASDTTFVTGLAALAGLDGWPSPRPPRDAAYRALSTPAEQAAWETAGPTAAWVPALEQTVARLVRAGGRVAVGSDTPAVPYGLGFHLELALLAEAGIANDQILRMATAEGALALGLERDIGTLEEGKVADFVVLDGDPLARIGDMLKIVAVAKGGVWRDRATLLTPP